MVYIPCVAVLDIAYGYVIEFCLRGTFKFLAFMLQFVIPTVA